MPKNLTIGTRLYCEVELLSHLQKELSNLTVTQRPQHEEPKIGTKCDQDTVINSD